MKCVLWSNLEWEVAYFAPSFYQQQITQTNTNLVIQQFTTRLDQFLSSELRRHKKVVWKKKDVN